MSQESIESYLDKHLEEHRQHCLSFFTGPSYTGLTLLRNERAMIEGAINGAFLMGAETKGFDIVMNAAFEWLLRAYQSFDAFNRYGREE